MQFHRIRWRQFITLLGGAPPQRTAAWPLEAYCNKLLAPVSLKHLAAKSLGPLLGSSGLKLLVVVDDEQLAGGSLAAGAAQSWAAAQRGLRRDPCGMGRIRPPAATQGALQPAG